MRETLKQRQDRISRGSRYLLDRIPAFLALVEQDQAEAIAASRRRARRQSALGFGLNRKNRSRLETKLAWWRNRYEQQAAGVLKGYKGSPDKASVLLSAGTLRTLPGEFADALEAVTEVIVEAFDAAIGDYGIIVFNKWPIDTGFSRTMMNAHLEVNDKGIRGQLLNEAPYAKFIQEAGYRIEEITNKKGKVVKKRTYGDLAKGRRMPSWKAQFIVGKGKSASFDERAYEAFKRQEGRTENWKSKPAKGHPGIDLLLKQERPKAQEIQAAIKRGLR